MIARVAQTLRKPFYRFLLRTTQDQTWKRYTCKVPLHVYGAGSRRCFSWYLDGAMDTGLMDLNEIKHWLQGCEYVSDMELFEERDVWQHPVTFERLRRGDCEDYSLWTWRKLLESGIDAEFCAGWSVHPGGEYLGHTWILFRDQQETYLFDPVTQSHGCMIKPLEEVADWYVPQVSVDGQLDRYVYGGYYNSLRPGWERASGRV